MKWRNARWKIGSCDYDEENHIMRNPLLGRHLAGPGVEGCRSIHPSIVVLSTKLLYSLPKYRIRTASLFSESRKSAHSFSFSLHSDGSTSRPGTYQVMPDAVGYFLSAHHLIGASVYCHSLSPSVCDCTCFWRREGGRRLGMFLGVISM